MTETKTIDWVECPRDAMQGIGEWIPTKKKVEYINALLKVNYSILDVGSFVSPKAIPQMKDTAEVLDQIADKGNTKLLAIVANERGAKDAIGYSQLDWLGYPLSLSETFQQRNTRASIENALVRIEQIQTLLSGKSAKLCVYLSMGFGNPYGEAWHEDKIAELAIRLKELEIESVVPSDTVGVSQPQQITQMFGLLSKEFPTISWGAHLHSSPHTAMEKILAVLRSPCSRLDMAIQGFGGCPLAKEDLVGNIATEKVLTALAKEDITHSMDTLAFESAYNVASDIFRMYH